MGELIRHVFVKYGVIAVLLAGGCLSDFYAKQWAKSHCKGKPAVIAVKGLLEFGFTENRGMVFGIFNAPGKNLIKSSLSGLRGIILAVVTVFICITIRRPLRFLIPYLLIWAGAAGNVIDNLRHGYVIDFIHIHVGKLLDWPFFFNLADAYLVIGMLYLIIQGIVVPRGQGSRSS
jgi:lipoprotein signal peptidase